jgi:hypothetical protein
MNSSKNPLSGFRYFLAGLKPLKKFTFWGPPLIIAVAALVYWQYRTHPEWLNTTFEQPEGVENVLKEDSPDNPDIGLEMPLSSIAKDAENQQQQSPLLGSLNPDPTLGPILGTPKNSQQATSGQDAFNQLTQKPGTQAEQKSESPQIFMPLLPNTINIKNPLSALSNNKNTQKPSSPVNPSTESPINESLTPKPGTLLDNPLQDAMKQLSTTNSTPTPADLPSPSNSYNSSQPDSLAGTNQIGAPELSQRVNNNFSNPTPIAQPPIQRNSVDPYQSPYLNSPVQVNPSQPPVAPYQSPYLNSPVQVNSVDSSVDPYQSPYLNSPVQPTDSITENQLNQPNYNLNRGEVQVQESIDF